MTIGELLAYLEQYAPPALQENYDNSGLIVGDRNGEIKAVLLSLDVTEEVLDEAISLGANLIIAHHPYWFGAIKRLTGNSYVERITIKAIKNNVAIYAMHTNLDSIENGINKRIADLLGVKNTRILSPKYNFLQKLVTFVPVEHAGTVRSALFDAGAGYIGNYDSCSYNLEGQGTFRALDGANPFVGRVGELHFEDEVRIETIFPKHLTNKIITALLNAHPYEEVAYDIYPLENKYEKAGFGIVGDIEPTDETAFLKKVKEVLEVPVVRHSEPLGREIKRVAICSGSCVFAMKDAIASGANILITADVKYHDFQAADGRIIIADIGHYESEKYAIEIFYDWINKKNNNFAVHITQVNTNFVKYL